MSEERTEEQMLNDLQSEQAAEEIIAGDANGNVAEEKVDDEDSGDGEDNHDAEIDDPPEENEQPTTSSGIPAGAVNAIDDIWTWPTSDEHVYAARKGFVNMEESKIGIGDTADAAILDLQKDEGSITTATIGYVKPGGTEQMISKINELVDAVNDLIG